MHSGGSEASLCLDSEPSWGEAGGREQRPSPYDPPPLHPPNTLPLDALPAHWSSKSDLNQLLGDPLKTLSLSVFPEKMTCPHPAYLTEQLCGLVEWTQAPGL